MLPRGERCDEQRGNPCGPLAEGHRSTWSPSVNEHAGEGRQDDDWQGGGETEQPELGRRTGALEEVNAEGIGRQPRAKERERLRD